jgi:hypothetical protein
MRPGIEPRVPCLIPRIDIGQAEVAAASLDKERGDSHIDPRSPTLGVGGEGEV